MPVRRARRLFSVVISLALLIPAGVARGGASEEPDRGSTGFQPEVSSSRRNDESPPLRSIPPIPSKPGDRIRILRLGRFEPTPTAGHDPAAHVDQSEQVQAAAGPAPAPIENFEGVPNVDGVLPPDTNGDVGPNHYVQMVNLSFAVFTRDGDVVYGPAANNTLWSGFGGPCEITNNGDPIVLFDHLAQRWLLSQFAIPSDEGPFFECIAISKTSDPTGAYFRYEFKYSDTLFNDYPKLGVWPDAYYMSVNEFTDVFEGAGVVAYERDQMLLGLPARQVIFHLSEVDSRFRSLLPSDLDGAPPAPGTPNYFTGVNDGSQLPPVDALRLWEFHVDWSDPAASTFGINGAPNQVIPTAPFNMMLCRTVRPPTRNCIPQPSGPPLDDLGDRLMYRLQYRTFGDHATLVTNHTVDADVNHAAVRWYQLEKENGAWSIAQQGTHAPNLHEHRWMASAALDDDGNMAVGYSVSGLATFPSIRSAGRLADDPPGTLAQTETTLIAGGGSQTFPIARWGDYSSMMVDSTDECTFWYTTEYYSDLIDPGLASWQTRVGSFRYPSCTPIAAGLLTGRVKDAGTGAPVQAAVVQAGAYTALTDARGRYRFPVLPVGTYDVEVSAFGYAPASASGVVVRRGRTTVRNFQLSALPTNSLIQGQVTDGSGQGWPLYARIDIEGYPLSPVFTDAVTGQYEVTLEPGDYEFTVSAPGYLPATRVVSVAGAAAEEFALDVDGVTCTAPGYAFQGAGIFEPFEGGDVPDGWSVADNSVFDGVWRFDDPGGRGNLTGGTGLFATVDSDFYGTLSHQDTELISPSMDFTEVSEVSLQFDTDFRWFSGSLDEKADVDVSTDGGDSWTNVWRKRGADYRGPAHEVVDVSSLAGGQPDVRVRFHYYDASFEWWWQVDNAQVGDLSCQPLAGGLVTGNVRDLHKGIGINGATVTSVQAPADTVTTVATPDDPAEEDGFYVLFSSLTGQRSFRAEKAGYRRQIATANVVAGGVTERNFSLQRL